MTKSYINRKLFNKYFKLKSIWTVNKLRTFFNKAILANLILAKFSCKYISWDTCLFKYVMMIMMYVAIFMIYTNVRLAKHNLKLLLITTTASTITNCKLY